MSGAAGEGLLGKGSWGRWRLRGPLRIEKIWIHRQAQGGHSRLWGKAEHNLGDWKAARHLGKGCNE